MWLLDKMLRKLVRKGELIVIDHDGKELSLRRARPQSRPGPRRG